MKLMRWLGASVSNSSEPLFDITAEYALRKNKMNLTETEWSKLLLEPYRYNWIVLPNDYCTERYPHIKILIVVYTAPENFKARAALRFMYKDKFYSELGVVILFCIGKSTSKAVYIRVQNEASTWNDIILQDYWDVYETLSYKV
ncbi:unnamed protein product [Enterobius vermicularis]|uniref:Hexosyltransferase n=1 Tax=Enterobius vermicularis TaxID=51028 RepID=A0A0N4VQN7_ENTVE|nr:unnamed protein product [Enterobius vermicularis]